MIDIKDYLKKDHILKIKDPLNPLIEYNKRIRIINYSEPLDDSYYIELKTGREFKNIPTTYSTNFDDELNFFPHGIIINIDIDKVFKRVYNEKK